MNLRRGDIIHWEQNDKQYSGMKDESAACSLFCFLLSPFTLSISAVVYFSIFFTLFEKQSIPSIFFLYQATTNLQLMHIDNKHVHR